MRNIILKAVIFATVSVMLTGCGNKDGQKDEGGGRNSEPRGDRGTGGSDQRACNSIEAISILSDGKTIISRIPSEGRVSWSLRDRKIRSFNFPLKPYLVSPTGKFIINKKSETRYELLELVKGRYQFKNFLFFSTYGETKFSFSQDSQKLLAVYKKKYSNLEDLHVEIIELNSLKVLNEFPVENLKMAKLAGNGKFLLLGTQSWRNSFISKINLETKKEEFTVRVGDFSYLEVTKDFFVIKQRYRYSSFDLVTGKEVFTEDYYNVYQLDHDSNTAFVYDYLRGSIVVHLRSGRELSKQRLPRDVTASSCRLSSSPLTLVCKYRVEDNKVLEILVESGESHKKCY